MYDTTYTAVYILLLISYRHKCVVHFFLSYNTFFYITLSSLNTAGEDISSAETAGRVPRLPLVSSLVDVASLLFGNPVMSHSTLIAWDSPVDTLFFEISFGHKCSVPVIRGFQATAHHMHIITDATPDTATSEVLLASTAMALCR